VFGVETRVWERVHDLGSGNPAIYVRPKPLPRDPAPLSTSSQCAQPASRDLCAKHFQGRRVAWYSVVVEVPLHHAAQPFALFRGGLVTPERQFALHLAGRNRHEEITHIGKRLDPVPLRSRQDAEASRRRLASAVAPDEHPILRPIAHNRRVRSAMFLSISRRPLSVNRRSWGQ
jgi:hypothetical protein